MVQIIHRASAGCWSNALWHRSAGGKQAVPDIAEGGCHFLYRSGSHLCTHFHQVAGCHTMMGYYFSKKSKPSHRPPPNPAGFMRRKQPNTYIEVTRNCRTAASKVKEKGPLSRGYRTQAVWEIQGGFEGVYCVHSGLRDKPHWQKLPTERQTLQFKLKKRSIPLKTFSASNGPHLIPGELFCTTEQDLLYNEVMKEHVDRMGHAQMLDDFLPQIKSGTTCDRGNVARTSGINGGENTKAGVDDEVTRPQPLCGTTREDVLRMVEATAMVYKVMEAEYKADPNLPKNPAILQDKIRLHEFALALCRKFDIPEFDAKGRPSNIFEMNTAIATLSVQGGDGSDLYLFDRRVSPQCFSCHIDDKNDPRYRDVWVVYKHVRDPSSGLWFRVGNVFTFRKSCSDYFKRLGKGRFLKSKQLRPYMEHYSNRMHPTLDDFHPEEYKDKPLVPIPRLPFFDKVAGCMSSSIDAVAELIFHNKWERNLQKIVELITPIGWSHGFANFPLVMKMWKRNGLPPDHWGHNGNLTVAFIKQCFVSFDGLNNGPNQRTQPFVNNSLTVRQCLHANIVVFETIQDILMKEAEEGVSEFTFSRASQRLKMVDHWQGLSSQHVLYVLGGLAIVPARFCAESEICEGTEAHKKLKQFLPEASINKCFHDLAEDMNETPMLAESGNCEFIREGDIELEFDADLTDRTIALRMQNKEGHKFAPDVMYYGSRMVEVTRKVERNGGFEVYHNFRRFEPDGTYTDERVLQHCRPLNDYNLYVNWNDRSFKQIMEMELQTSQGSKLIGERKRKRNAKTEDGSSADSAKRARMEDEIIDLATNGETFKGAIKREQRLSLSGAIVRTRRSGQFTAQMIFQASRDNGTYHFFQLRETALSLMVDRNVKRSGKCKARAVKTECVSTESGLRAYTCSIFGIPLMKQSPYTLPHGIVDVENEKRACYATKAAAEVAAYVRGILQFPYRRGQTVNGVPKWADNILPQERKKDVLRFYCCLHSHRFKKIRGKGSTVIDPSFFGVLWFQGSDLILSVSKRGDPKLDYHDFNLSEIHRDLATMDAKKVT